MTPRTIKNLLAVLLISSCTRNTQDNSFQFKIIEDELHKSGVIIEQRNIALCKSLENETTNSNEKAEIWYPKAMMIKELSDSLISYIDNLKNELRGDSGNKGGDNYASVESLFIKKNKSKELYQKLKEYDISLLQVDPEIYSVFKNKLTITSADWYNEKDFTENLFKESSLSTAKALLSTLQNDIKISENKLLEFCINRTEAIVEVLNSFSVLISQNKSFLKPGEELEIKAGIGAFTSVNKPEIIIGGVKVPVLDGVATTKMSTSKSTRGEFIVPVSVSFIDVDGRHRSQKFTVKYTIE